jgi:hypothetical protein
MQMDSWPLKSRRTSWSRTILPPIAATVLLLAAIPKSLQWHPAFLEPGWNVVYRIHNGVWHPRPGLPGEPEKLQVSSSGQVWALLWHFGVGSDLARWDGRTWRVYTAADFGVKDPYDTAGFVLNGEEVWAPPTKGSSIGRAAAGTVTGKPSPAEWLLPSPRPAARFG